MKRLIALAMALTLCLALIPTAFAAETAEIPAHTQALKSLGLFRGSNIGLELDRAPTRMEALIMTIRLMGKENEALSGEWEHPFTDAPTWDNAGLYLGYAFETGLTNGVTATTFDPNTNASAQVVYTMTLRLLGYADTEEGTVWENWKTLGEQAKNLTDAVKLDNFTRGEASLVYWLSLDSKIAGKEVTLLETLVEGNVVTEAQCEIARAIYAGTVNLETSSLETIMAAVYAGADADFSRTAVLNTVITADNVDYYLGTDSVKFTDALASEPMMTASAHSICLIRVEDGVDIEQAKKDIKENVNPRKWICVGVFDENVLVENHGNLIILVMNNSYSKELVASFNALAK